VAGLFSLGFSLAAPVAFCLLLVDLALGIVARNLPQMNMIAMGIPVKIVVALIALTLWAGGLASVMQRVYGSIFRTWSDTFALVARSA
jgi:flagellar biosynthetic protein FliR